MEYIDVVNRHGIVTKTNSKDTVACANGTVKTTSVRILHHVLSLPQTCVVISSAALEVPCRSQKTVSTTLEFFSRPAQRSQLLQYMTLLSAICVAS